MNSSPSPIVAKNCSRVRVGQRMYEQVAQLAELNSEIDRLAHVNEILTEDGEIEIVTQSDKLTQAIQDLKKAAQTDSPILLLGETGTGKEVFARAAHRMSRRADKIFRAINCGGIPESLAESELFGHVEGAFTHAVRQRDGMFKKCSEGTLFLDELGELPLVIQAKLLRVLQDKEFQPVGSDETYTTRVRVIAATNKDVAQAVQDKSFRSDLYARLNVFPIHLPPLRERRSDIEPLALQFLAKISQERGKPGLRFSPAALRALVDYDWPQNIRELRNAVDRAVTYSNREIQPEDLRLPQGPVMVPVPRPVNAGGASLPGPGTDPSRSLEKFAGQLAELASGSRVDLETLIDEFEATFINATRLMRDPTLRTHSEPTASALHSASLNTESAGGSSYDCCPR